MPAHTLVIDLASKPGGTDFRYAEKRVKALLAPGLPGIVAQNGWANLSKCSFSVISDECNRKGGKEMSLKETGGFGFTGSLYV